MTRVDENPFVSVIICTRNRPDMIPMAVESVLKCDYPNFDLHVMDQSTDSQTSDYVRSIAETDPRLHYHHLDQPGLSRSYNAGFRVSKGEYIACTDDDVVVPEHWIRRIVDRFESDPKIGLIYGQVLVPAALRSAASDGLIVPALEIPKLEHLNREKGNFITFGMGADCMVRRSMLADVIGYDEALGGGAPLRSSQDFDFSYRTYLAGWTVCLDPNIVVDHYGTRMAEQWADTLKNYGIGDGAYYGKHARLGDRWAISMLAKRRRTLLLSRLGGLLGRRSNNHVYLENVVVGERMSHEFDVDAVTRLYKTRDGSAFGVSASNQVVAANPVS